MNNEATDVLRGKVPDEFMDLIRVDTADYARFISVSSTYPVHPNTFPCADFEDKIKNPRAEHLLGYSFLTYISVLAIRPRRFEAKSGYRHPPGRIRQQFFRKEPIQDDSVI